MSWLPDQTLDTKAADGEKPISVRVVDNKKPTDPVVPDEPDPGTPDNPDVPGTPDPDAPGAPTPDERNGLSNQAPFSCRCRRASSAPDVRYGCDHYRGCRSVAGALRCRLLSCLSCIASQVRPLTENALQRRGLTCAVRPRRWLCCLDSNHETWVRNILELSCVRLPLFGSGKMFWPPCTRHVARLQSPYSDRVDFESNLVVAAQCEFTNCMASGMKISIEYIKSRRCSVQSAEDDSSEDAGTIFRNEHQQFVVFPPRDLFL